MVSLRAALTALSLAVSLLAAPARARADGSPGDRAIAAPEEPSLGGAVPELTEPPARALVGKPIRRVEVVVTGGRWTTPPAIQSVRLGEPLSTEVARRAMREVLAGGQIARANVEAFAEGDGAALRVHVLPRRLIARIQLNGGALDTAATLEAAEVSDGGEITAPLLGLIRARIRRYYDQHGFPFADATADTTDTDDPTSVVLAIQITPGLPQTLAQRIFVIDPRVDREVGDLKSKYRITPGARLDEPTLADADRELGELLRQKGFLRAEIHHNVVRVGVNSSLEIHVDAGPRLVPAFDGNRAFDGDQLTEALDLEKQPDGRLAELTDRLRAFYVARGFFDAEVVGVERGAPTDPVHYLVFTVRENRQVRVIRRVYPCLGKEVLPDDVGSEIDSFLDEELPGSATFSSGDPRAIARIFGPTVGTGGRGLPADLNPLVTYAPETYERALKHLRDLYHSKGYLNAVIGPITPLRATCKGSSPAGLCLPEPAPAGLRARCLKDSLGLPLPEPAVADAFTCRPDPAHNVECSPEITLRIPIALGPQMTLYDLAFEGNRSLTEHDLGKIAALPLGDPLSNVDLEAARIRVLDEYRLRGYAYADVRAALEPSPDRTRARVRFTVTERDRVVVSGFVIKGNKHTVTSVILRRLLLRRNGYYQQDLVRQSEERLATLGVFASVSVALEDPEVPQKRKRVVVTVAESGTFSLGAHLGFSTGEGVRFGVDLEGRNIGGLAITFGLHLQLGYVPDFLILDEAVRQNFGIDPVVGCTVCTPLPILDRLERRNTISLTFPEIGLPPAFGLAIEGIDVRHNQRDFGLTKDAVVPTLSYRPFRGLTTQFSVSAERNSVKIFNPASQTAVQTGTLLSLRAPEGTTLALSQRANFTLDLRDNPFNATRGGLFSTSVEHVNAFPLLVDDNQATVFSHFLRFTGRVAAYISLPRKLVLAMSVAAGYNLQLYISPEHVSKTYPDRAFFLGGVDSIRSFLADSVVPQDVANRIVDGDPARCTEPGFVATPNRPLSICDVQVRGGDVMVNPRAELRIPITETFQAGVFVDAGNVWTGTGTVNVLVLRYAGGAGIRIATPIGPIALDYGINLNRRQWEDFGAFHFSIGLF
ncbi:MAG: POTRA domain-containing protein [Byssovorax sp.]